jgi:predicted metal-dependent HD superfamily phosphohydrolase
MTALELESAWHALWTRLGAHGDPATVFADLARRYSEPQRAYHTLDHVSHCLAELRDAQTPPASRDAIEFALWFHDAVYDPRAKDNEEASALLARHAARAAGLSESFTALAADLILATRHTAPPVSGEAQLTVDIDLAILGQPPARFDEYERQIRIEYSWVDDTAFAKGRGDFVAAMLARPAIYSTHWFHRRYEAQARENLARSLAMLRHA